MPSINLDLDYFDHRQTKRLVGLLGHGAELLPLRLWTYCGKFHSDTGSLADYMEEEIETLAGWWGKPGQMLPAMVKCEWMEQRAGKWRMTNWLKWQGHLVAYKKRASLASQARWKKLKVDASSNASSILQASFKHCSYDTRLNLQRKAERLNDATGPPDTNGQPLIVQRSSPNRSVEKELMGRLREALGEDEMARAGGHWRANWVRKFPSLVDRGLADLTVQIREGKQIANRGAWLQDLLNRWATND